MIALVSCTCYVPSPLDRFIHIIAALRFNSHFQYFLYRTCSLYREAQVVAGKERRSITGPWRYLYEKAANVSGTTVRIQGPVPPGSQQ